MFILLWSTYVPTWPIIPCMRLAIMQSPKDHSTPSQSKL